MTPSSHSDCFLNCDWGTTRFRLRLVKRATAEILAEVSSQQGVGSLSVLPQPQRAQAFHDILAEQIEQLSAMAPQISSPLPVMISGMASSSIGWRELPYARTPFPLTGENLQTNRLEGTGSLAEFPLFLFSGVRSDRDVMRGEEIELIGIDLLLSQAGHPTGDYQVILPGTHSKHAHVQQGILTGFRTCLTGELFQVLGKNSSLRHAQGEMTARPGPSESEQQLWERAFIEGVELSQEENLIRSVFQVRTGQLLRGDTPVQSGGFLSGLLVGSELQTFHQEPADAGMILLAAAPDLARPYELASRTLHLQDRIKTIAPEDVNRLTALGQSRVLPRLLPERT